MNNFQNSILVCFLLGMLLIPLEVISQNNGSLSDCKKWFKTAMKEYKTDYYNFPKKHCKIPFLYGTGGDAYYSYSALENDGLFLEATSNIFECSKQLPNNKKLVFKEFTANEESLSILSNSYEFNERDENGKKINPNAKPPYDGFITFGEKVYVISYNCGAKHPSYNTSPVYDLFVIFDKATKSYKFWAATSGL